MLPTHALYACLRIHFLGGMMQNVKSAILDAPAGQHYFISIVPHLGWMHALITRLTVATIACSRGTYDCDHAML